MWRSILKRAVIFAVESGLAKKAVDWLKGKFVKASKKAAKKLEKKLEKLNADDMEVQRAVRVVSS